jgi:hydroxyethylthiazole kinase-like uncharacterized protein yjeF
MEIVTGLPVVKKRPADSHKGDFGAVFVLAGSCGMTGAAYLCCKAALRSGAGLVRLGVPESILHVMAVKLTCTMTVPLPESPEGSLSDAGLKQIMAQVEAHDALAVGPGISTHPSTVKLVLSVLPRVTKPMIVDADALNIIAAQISVLRAARNTTVITPHPGEMARLTHKTTKEVQADREKIAVDFAKKNGVIVVLKGHGTIVTDGNRAYVNGTGNPGMATAGSGDVLTGAIAGLLAQGIAPFDACRIGVHAHGLAGDLAAEKLGQASLIATDILEHIPAAFLRLEVNS